MRWRTLILISLVWLLALPLQAQDEGQVTHTVAAGENLFRIALRYGVTMDELAAANDITDYTLVFTGQVLVIPGLDAPDTSDDIENPLVAAAPIVHVVQQGEILSQIAAQYGVTVDSILQANNISNADLVFAGESLQIWTSDISAVETEAVVQPDTVGAVEPDSDAIIPTEVPATTSTATHTVAPGEHLSQIARFYGVSWTAIAEANGITDPNRITVGQVLIIPGAVGQAAASALSNVPTIAENLDDPGAHWGVGREIVVDLSTQMTYAYEDGNLVFSALVSTGLPATPTVQGEYAIWHRTPAQTMSGPGYYLPNVQWVMYFYQGYGFHGTYWHSNFGQPMSHGCVNMTNEDAQWLYNFGSIGTNVWVQY